MVKICEPLGHRLGFGAVEVDLGAIAGRQDRRFLDPLPTDQVAQRLAQRLGLEHDLLPHLERRGGVVEAEGVKRHGWQQANCRLAHCKCLIL